jgi:hypothetical protein
VADPDPIAAELEAAQVLREPGTGQALNPRDLVLDQVNLLELGERLERRRRGGGVRRRQEKRAQVVEREVERPASVQRRASVICCSAKIGAAR